MPLHETKFNKSWLEKIDSNGISVNRWLKPGSDSTTFICTICNTGNICCSNKRWPSIERHMNNKKHRDKIKLIQENSSFFIQSEPSLAQSQHSSSSSSTIAMVTLDNPRKNLNFTDQVTYPHPQNLHS